VILLNGFATSLLLAVGLLSACGGQIDLASQQLTKNEFSATIKVSFMISKIEPQLAMPGDSLHLFGSGFSREMALEVDGTAVDKFEVVDEANLSFVVPPGSPGLKNLALSFQGNKIASHFVRLANATDKLVVVASDSPSEFCLGHSYFNMAGEEAAGTRHCDEPVTTASQNPATLLRFCSGDGEKNCVTTAAFAAAETAQVSAKVLAGETVAGIAGNVVLPVPGNVFSGISYGVSGTGMVGLMKLPAAAKVLTGTPAFGDPGAALTPSYNPDFPTPSNVLASDTVNGIAGTLTLPAGGEVLAAIPFGVDGNGSTGSLTLPSAANVRTGNGAFGPAGTGVTPTLGDCAADGGVGCVAVAEFKAADMTNVSAGNIKSGTTIAGVSGAVVPTAPLCGSDGENSCVVDGTTYKAAAITGLAAKVLSGQTVAGTAGNVTLPVVGDVFAGIAYGVGGTGSSGTLTLATAANVRIGNGAFGRSGTSVTPLLSDCSTDGGTSCVAIPTFKAADMMNVVAGNIKNAVTIASVTGNVIVAPANCGADGATSCVAVTNFPAVDKVNNITANTAKIRDSVTIAGVVGTLPDCVDGGSGCVTIGPLQAAATVAGSASKILSGQAVAGVAGNVTLPADGKVLTGIQFGVSGTGQSGSLTLPAAGNVLTASGTYGDPGAAVTPSFSPDYPTVGNVLSTDTVNSVSGTLTLPGVGDVNSGVAYGVAGTGSTGTLTLPTAGNVLTGSGTFGNPGAAITPTLTLPIAGNVKSGTANYGNPGSAITPAYSPDFPAVANVYSDTVDGAAGTLTIPVVGDVYTGIAYGVAGTGSTGTLTLATAANVRAGNGVFGRSGTSVTPLLSDCSTDGGTSCVAVSAFKAADMTNVVAGNIKNAITIAAVTGSVTPAPANCAADGATSCVAVTNFPAVDKVNNITANAAKVRDSVTIAGVVGTLADCTEAASGCVAIGPLQAVAIVAGVASKVLSGQSVAGVGGNVTLPAVGKVLTGIQFGVSGTGQTGTLTLPAAGNVLTASGTYGDPGAAVTPSFSPDYPTVGNVLSSDTVNSVSGTLTLPGVGDVNSGVVYGVAGTGSTGTLNLPTAGNVLTGSGTFGNPGSAVTPTLTLPIAANVKTGSANYGNPGSAITPTYSPDFPAVANVYNDTVDSAAGTLTLPTVGNVYTGIVYGVAGTGSTGTLTVPTAANVRTGNGTFGQAGTSVTPTLADCSTDGGTSCVAVAGFKAADMSNVVAAKIKSGVTIAAVVGDYPSATNPLAGADATADLVFATFDAKIKAATNFEWFDSSGTRYVNSGDADIVDTNIVSTANIFGTQGTVIAPIAPNSWDVRIGQTINGVAGQLKTACRNSANTTVFDAGAFKNAVATKGTDIFTVTAHGYVNTDTVRYTAQTAITNLTATTTTYFVVSSTANTFQLAATSGGAAINFTSNGAGVVVYKWNDGTRDIWDTIDDYNNNGATFTSASMPSAWTSDNFCGGAGTAASSAVWTDTTTDGTCDTAGDECRFKDKITGLEWSEFQSASAAWGTAMTTCGNLSFGGAGAWRLPTQKELMAAYEHGIYAASNANWLTKAQMDATYFWSSSTVSSATLTAWAVFLSYGSVANVSKTSVNQVQCVR
jgi:hypothetical protein